MRGRSSILALLGVAWFAAGATPEYQVKAAYVYNFAKFVEWPNAESLSGITICIYGRDPFGGFIDETVQGKLAHGLPIVVRRLSAADDGSSGCQVLFVGVAKTAQAEPILARLKGRSVLTVGESAGFAEAGGMIGLVVDRDRVRFDINVAALDSARLKASSRLIEIGRVVRSAK